MEPVPAFLRRSTASGLVVFASACGANSAVAESWGCYDPKPEHPTAAERQRFVKDISTLAVNAEQKHGVPAAALAAMAIVESGYGWTRTALEAHNFFGWKFYSATASGNRPSYVLGCQPPEDDNNRYVNFASAADAMDFVAGKLATLPAYRAKGAAYRKARAEGAGSQDASRVWIAGIANPYNWKPEEYIKNVTRIMNDALSPSDQVSPESNLYSLSKTVNVKNTTLAAGPANSAVPVPAPYLVAIATKALDFIKPLECEPPRSDYPGWSTFPVQLCTYNEPSVISPGTIVKARTFMLNADTDRLAHWTVTACEDAAAIDMKRCIAAMARAARTAASGNVFPVAGYIPETRRAAGGTKGNLDEILCLPFRDGVTAYSKKFPDTSLPKDNVCVDEDGLNEQAITKAMTFARIVSTTRQDYKDHGGKDAVGTDVDHDPRWLNVVRALYQRAWNRDRNELMSAKAKAMKGEGQFK